MSNYCIPIAPYNLNEEIIYPINNKDHEIYKNP